MFSKFLGMINHAERVLSELYGLIWGSLSWDLQCLHLMEKLLACLLWQIILNP